MNPLDLTTAYITALTGNPDTVLDWRVINDRDKGDYGKNLRGSLAELLPTLQQYNAANWGIFICVNAMDGFGQTLDHVHHIRTHFADLDDTLTSHDAYNRAVNSDTPPHIAVQTSPGKYHLYWLTEPYTGNDFFSTQQRKIVQLYNSDKQVTDATRVLRVPGFNHCKGDPQIVTCWQIHSGARYTSDRIAQHLQTVNVVEHFSNRKPLGDPSLAAPSLEWLVFALNLMDPNQLGRDEWMPLTAAFKQAGWSLASEQHLLDIWHEWCNRYAGNDAKENMKLWNSLRDSEVGWGRFERLSNLKVYYHNDPLKPPVFDTEGRIVRAGTPGAVSVPPPPVQGQIPSSEGLSVENLPDILDIYGKQAWFKDCFFVEKEGEIFTPSGRFMNSTQFNGAYGGKEFCLKKAGAKVSDEAWKAALRSTDWRIPKVDHVRFLPDLKPLEIVLDRRGRRGLNTYQPVIIDARQGDVTLWLQHIAKILPDQNDQRIFCEYLAHMVKFPGHKIPWTILLQGVEGLGKSVFFEVLQHALGDMYVYRPKASDLISSGSKFNAWMRAKLAIVVDEIKVDERRELIEILKPMITDKIIEIQAKGVDQDMEDNPANWLLFSNFKDAVPLSKNGRRYSVMFSALQTTADLMAAGMDKFYFDNLWNWLRTGGGLQAITYWLQNYPINAGDLPVNAPATSSQGEALRIGRSPLEILIDSKIEAAERGFRGGYISWPMLVKAVENSSMRFKPAEYNIQAVLEGRGYHQLGYTAAPIGGEDLMKPSMLYGIVPTLRVEDYERAQA